VPLIAGGSVSVPLLRRAMTFKSDTPESCGIAAPKTVPQSEPQNLLVDVVTLMTTRVGR